MGSYASKILSQEELEEYSELTYLSKPEILHILSRFRQVGAEVDNNRHHRYHWARVVDVFQELRHNPFQDRISQVFSSMKDSRMSFEDMLDLCSAFSENCPVEVRAKWAFLLFDFDGDKQIDAKDIIEVISRLTDAKYARQSTREGEEKLVDLTLEEKKEIAIAMMTDLDLDETGSITLMEFVHAVSKIPEFSHSFRLKL